MNIKIDNVTDEFDTTPKGLNEEVNAMFALLKRVYKCFERNHFTDFKMIKEYVSPVRFNKILGEDIVDYLRKKLNGFEYEYMNTPSR